jgi:hypothetical protein
VVGSSPVQGTGQNVGGLRGGVGGNSEEETSEASTSQKYTINLLQFLHNLSDDLLLLLLFLLFLICYRQTDGEKYYGYSFCMKYLTYVNFKAATAKQ